MFKVLFICTLLFEFSYSLNNDEMGIYVKKKDDPELYNDILNEVQRLLTISEEIRVSVKIIRNYYFKFEI